MHPRDPNQMQFSVIPKAPFCFKDQPSFLRQKIEKLERHRKSAILARQKKKQI